MKKLAICTVVLFAAVFCCAQQPKEEFPKQLDPQPGFAEFKGLSCRAGLPVHLSEEKCFTVDFRSCDFSKEDLSGLEKGLGGLDQKTVAAFLQFDDKTIWPKGNKMPEWLKPQEIMKIGKTPGLNIKQLHTQGITGKGVGLAIIDQGLPKHAEYQNRLVFFKNRQVLTDSLMHGAAVSSIAVGKNVGVAPEAYLYYISAIFSADENEIFDAGPISEAIEELLSLNKTLPDDKKIAVISISRGFGDRNKGRSGFLKVLEKAKKQNIAIFTTNDITAFSRGSHMLNPDNLSSYTFVPPNWSQEYATAMYDESVAVPTAFRILASPTGYNDWVAYDGECSSHSWGVPYYAGVYALAKQVYPTLDRETFENAARATAHSKKIKDEKTGTEVEVKYLINPVGLIKHLSKKTKKSGKTSDKSADEQRKVDTLKQGINKTLEEKIKSDTAGNYLPSL